MATQESFLISLLCVCVVHILCGTRRSYSMHGYSMRSYSTFGYSMHAFYKRHSMTQVVIMRI